MFRCTFIAQSIHAYMGQKSGNGESMNTNRRVANKYSTAPIYNFTPNLAYWRIDFLSFLLRWGGVKMTVLRNARGVYGLVLRGVGGGGVSCLIQCSHRPTPMPKPSPPQARPTPPPPPLLPPPPLTGPGYAPGG